MAVDSGNARLIKDEPRAFALKQLKSSEIMMLFFLVIVVIAAVGIYFVLLPMYTNLSRLNQDIEGLKSRELEYRNQIVQLESFQKMYDEAQTDYNNYISCFYGPMEPELIDERITSMLIAHGMTPASLTMASLSVEHVSFYAADELRINPVPVPMGDAAAGAAGAGGADAAGASGAGDASGAGAGDAGGADASGAGASGAGSTTENTLDEIDSMAPPVGPAETAYDCYAFVYTVNVGAYGDRDNLYAFMAQAAPMTAMEITGFDYIDPVTVKDSDKNDSVIPGKINMKIKLYVFVEGVPAADHAGRR